MNRIRYSKSWIELEPGKIVRKGCIETVHEDMWVRTVSGEVVYFKDMDKFIKFLDTLGIAHK